MIDIKTVKPGDLIRHAATGEVCAVVAVVEWAGAVRVDLPETWSTMYGGKYGLTLASDLETIAEEDIATATATREEAKASLASSSVDGAETVVIGDPVAYISDVLDYSPGDRIRYLSSGEEGVVIEVVPWAHAVKTDLPWARYSDKPALVLVEHIERIV
jgi:hypothetical protein